MYLDQIVIRRVKEVNTCFVEKGKGHKHKAFQTDDMKIRYDCAKGYHVLYINCAKGILFGL